MHLVLQGTAALCGWGTPELTPTEMWDPSKTRADLGRNPSQWGKTHFRFFP